jgi:hypothetical protein
MLLIKAETYKYEIEAAFQRTGVLFRQVAMTERFQLAMNERPHVLSDGWRTLMLGFILVNLDAAHRVSFANQRTHQEFFRVV